jgi:hypothetical protein
MPAPKLPTPAPTPQANKLSPGTNQNLLAAEKNVGPKTQDALNAALAGQLLSDSQRGYLLGALEQNPKLTPTQKAAIATALQRDLDTKRQLAIAGSGSGNGGGWGGGSGDGGTPAPEGGTPGGGEPAAAATYQSVRYLRVSNQTGEALRIYVQFPGEDQPKVWNFQAGQTAYLAVDDVKVTASEVLIWAASETKVWNQNKTEALKLGTFPYPSDRIATHTQIFQP